MADAVGPKIIELSQEAYLEVESKLMEAGYDFLLWKRHNETEAIQLGEWVIVRGEFKTRVDEAMAEVRRSVVR